MRYSMAMVHKNRLTILYFVILGYSHICQADSEFFPGTEYYPTYLASPLSSTFSAQRQNYSLTTIPDTGSNRTDTKIGSVFSIWRTSPDDNRELGWQLTLEAGFHAQFDIDHFEDNIGWDGIYGLYFDNRFSSDMAQRIGFHHVSSHIGDELIARTGLTRNNYSRVEFIYGLTWMTEHMGQTYIEYGYALDLRNKQLQLPRRLQAGVQYKSKVKWKGIFNWYAAMDVSAYDENDWDTNNTFQLGLITENYGVQWRFGFEFYDGRGQIGEFFQEHERYAGFGLWIDI